MARKKLHHGVGSVCEVLLKYLHSRPIVAAKYPNATARQRLGGLLCIRKEMKKVNHKQIMCYVFRHDEFEGHELHCMDRWAKVTAEGDPAHFFTKKKTKIYFTLPRCSPRFAENSRPARLAHLECAGQMQFSFYVEAK